MSDTEKKNLSGKTAQDRRAIIASKLVKPAAISEEDKKLVDFYSDEAAGA